MSSDKLMIEMTCEEFRQREQQTTKLAEELDELRKKLATMRKIGDEEITGGRMAFADWKKRSKQFTDLYGRFGQSHLGAIETACQAAYKAGERDGRKQAEAVAEQAIKLRELVRHNAALTGSPEAQP